MLNSIRIIIRKNSGTDDDDNNNNNSSSSMFRPKTILAFGIVLEQLVLLVRFILAHSSYKTQ